MSYRYNDPPTQPIRKPQPESPWIRWVVICAVVLVAGCGAWYAWGYFQAKGQLSAIQDGTSGAGGGQAGHSSSDPSQDLNNDGVVSELEKISADGVVTKEELSSLSNPRDSQNVSPKDLVTAYAGDFDNWRQDTYDILESKGWLNDEQKAVLAEMPNNGQPKAQWTDQMVSNAIGLDVADSDIQEDKGVGVLMMPTVLAPTAVNFEDARDNADKKIATITFYIIERGYKLKTNEFMGRAGLSGNARILIGNIVTNTRYSGHHDTTHIATLVDLRDGQDGAQSWCELGSWDADDADFLVPFRKAVY